MRKLLAGCVVLVMAGCQSAPQPAPTPPPSPAAVRNTPLILPDADRPIVEAGVRAHLGGAPTATFRTMLASKGTDGITTVCGYVNTGKDTPYIGTLAGGAFTVAAIGGAAEATIAVHKACGQRGIHI